MNLNRYFHIFEIFHNFIDKIIKNNNITDHINMFML